MKTENENTIVQEPKLEKPANVLITNDETQLKCNRCDTTIQRDESGELYGIAKNDFFICYNCNFAEHFTTQVPAEKQELPAEWINSKTMDEDVIPKACQKQLDKLLKEISKTEKEKAPNVLESFFMIDLESLFMIDNIEEKYNQILKEDPLVLRSEKKHKIAPNFAKVKKIISFQIGNRRCHRRQIVYNV